MKDIKKRVPLLAKPGGGSYLVPFILITSLFLLWGFAHSLLDLLNKHFQDALHLNKAQSGAVQASAYGAYFLAALPAGYIARRFGYKSGILIGLTLFAIGAFWFVPAVKLNEFWAFLLGLLILFFGLTFLETVANPYTTVLGPSETAASRINFSQTFNAIGWILGPLLGSILIFKNETGKSPLELFIEALQKVFLGVSDTVQQTGAMIASAPSGTHTDNSVLIVPYVGLGVVVLLVLIMFYFTKLPEVSVESAGHGTAGGENSVSHFANKPLIKQRHFVLAVVAQFLYVAAQTGVGSFFINYSVEVKGLGLTEMQAGILLSLGGFVLFAVGRFVGSLAMRVMQPGSLLGTFALINTMLMAFTFMRHDRFGLIAMIMSYLFMSLMFPSIFALGLRGLGAKTKTASSILVMTVAGGAIAPALMGVIGEHNMNNGFIIPLICFAFIAFYGFVGCRISQKKLV